MSFIKCTLVAYAVLAFSIGVYLADEHLGYLYLGCVPGVMLYIYAAITYLSDVAEFGLALFRNADKE